MYDRLSYCTPIPILCSEAESSGVGEGQQEQGPMSPRSAASTPSLPSERLVDGSSDVSSTVSTEHPDKGLESSISPLPTSPTTPPPTTPPPTHDADPSTNSDTAEANSNVSINYCLSTTIL